MFIELSTYNLCPFCCWVILIYSMSHLYQLYMSYIFMYACVLSCFLGVQLFATLWTVARQAALSLGFSQQEYWNGLLFPPPGDLLHPGIKPSSVQFSRSVVSDSLRPHESQHTRPPCPSPTPGIHSDSHPLNQ